MTVSRPSDVLFVGDSMIKNFQVYEHPLRVWKYSYPGATAEDLHNHFMTEKLPGELQIGAVIISIGTNDLSRSRNRFRSDEEVFRCLKLFTMKLAKMYPQADIIFCSILPRVDFDDSRVRTINFAMKRFILGREDRYQYYHCYDHFTDNEGLVIKHYYRDSSTDSVHLSDSGTQVQQDIFSRLLRQIHRNLPKKKIDYELLMWQENWEYFNMFNTKTAGTRKNAYLVGKRLTNFTDKQHAEIIQYETTIKTNIR